MKKAISPLLAAVILVALVISVAFIVSSAISGMAQRQAATASETAQASGAMLQIDLNSVTCTNITPTQWQMEMVVRLLGTTKNATGVSVVIKDVNGNLITSSSVNPNYLEPGVNVIKANLSSAPSQGSLQYLAISTESPSIYAEYSSETFGNIGSCSESTS